jgi:two-component sensor histidine kinase
VNGNEKVLKGYLKANFNDDGEFIELVTFIHEITEQVKREKELETLSEDRKLLLQEVHHRVKNNLQLILSFLNIESRFNKNNPEYVIEQTRNRIRTMALTHEEVYQSQNVSSVNLESFLSKNMYNLFKLYDNKRIDLNFKMEPVEVNIDIGIPLGLLINELAINCIKYAFPEKDEGNFYINVSEKENIITIKVWDDGVGLPDGVDLNNNNEGLGFLIIQRLSQQLEAELKVLNNRQGFGIELKFKNDYGGLYCIK